MTTTKDQKLHARVAHEQAMAETADARIELQAATSHAHRCKLIEGDALSAWLGVNPSPSQDAVFRDLVARQNAARLERVEKGLPPEEVTVPKVGKSPIDQFAYHRGRAGTRTSLRSAVVRR
jgi:hypothetical protein